MIRPHPRYHELYQLRGRGLAVGRAGAPPVPRARPPRPPGLVEPDLDAPAPLREGRRARRVPRQGAPLHRGREAMAPGQATRPAGPDHPAAPQARRAGPGRADDHPLLPPDPPPALRQAAGPRGDAPRRPAELSRRLPRGRRGPRPSRRRVPPRALRPSPARDVAERGLRLPGDAPAPGPPRHRVDRHRRGDPRLLHRRQGRPRRQGPRPPPRPALSPVEGRRGAGTSWASSSATMPSPTRSASTISAAPGPPPPPTSSASSTPSATPAATTPRRSSP